jgi:CTP synthase
VFVTGGVVSGLGKGISAASLGTLLKARGVKVSLQKCDPYLNVDPGTMSPFQHGEVFVTEDGAETDLDLGHYERFTDESLTRISNVTTGAIYDTVIKRERRGDFLGATVQVIPHVTDEIKARIKQAAASSNAEVVIVEIGGTVGDIESLPFLEAIRQLRNDVGREHVCFVHVTLVPYLDASGELKTKTTQHSVNELRRIGIEPDVLVLRSNRPLTDDIRQKIALYGGIPTDAVISAVDAGDIYEVPLNLEAEGFAKVVCHRLGRPAPPPDLTDWRRLVDAIGACEGLVRIALVGKYVQLHDAYLSVAEALKHAAIHHGVVLEIDWVDAEAPDLEVQLERADGVLVPGGFGGRGIEGKIAATRFARERSVPFLGICLGMQIAVIEYARHVCAMDGANSSEFDPETPYPVIDLLPEQRAIEERGGTMRLGADPVHMVPGTRARAAYGDQDVIYERHRHRYEVNPALR